MKVARASKELAQIHVTPNCCPIKIKTNSQNLLLLFNAKKVQKNVLQYTQATLAPIQAK